MCCSLFRQSLGFLKSPDNLDIARKEIKLGEFVRPGPASRLKLAVVGLASVVGDSEEKQRNRVLARVGVLVRRHAGTDQRLDAELFGQLPGERNFGTLPRFDLAAGELPLAGMSLILTSLAS